MKSVLISIQPKWCELIASGKKTVDVRKTKPKIETPFKVYIYCTQLTPYNPVLPMRYEKEGGNIYTGGKEYAEFLTGKVIGEFVCDEIITAGYGEYYKIPYLESQVDALDLMDYADGKNVYGWRISDLVIYDKPKELSELSRYGYGQFVPVKRPPESWCYVEELKPCPPEKDTENWLLSRGVFVDCRNCVNRKAGCFKDCKFYQGYRKGERS